MFFEDLVQAGVTDNNGLRRVFGIADDHPSSDTIAQVIADELSSINNPGEIFLIEAGVNQMKSLVRRIPIFAL